MFQTLSWKLARNAKQECRLLYLGNRHSQLYVGIRFRE